MAPHVEATESNAAKKKRVTTINDYELPPKQTRSRTRRIRGLTSGPTVPDPPASDGTTPSTRVTRSSIRTAAPSPVVPLIPQPIIPSTRATRSSFRVSVPLPAALRNPQSIVPSPQMESNQSPDTLSSAVAVGPEVTGPPLGTRATTMSAPSEPDAGLGSEPLLPHEKESTIAIRAKKPATQAALAPPIADKDFQARQDAFRRKEQRLVREQEGRDFLLQRPTPGYSYLDKKDRVAFTGDRFAPEAAESSESSEHPKIVEARKRGTMTPQKAVWYQDMPHSVNIPLAGIPSNKPYNPRYPAHPAHARSANPGLLPGAVEGPVADMNVQEDAFHARPSVKLIIPDILKAMLVDDWENVTKNCQLVPLPHPHPVTKILEDYAAYETPKRLAGSSHLDILQETLAGMKEYFDKSLGRILLYRFERAQYADMYKKWMSDDPEYQGKTASDTYGPEHLMRLLVSLPELIAQTNMDQQSVNRLREELAKFCTWLSKNTTEYFVSHYETPPLEYIQKAKE